ncbi:MAG TPA: lipoprotein, partial [Candidatus Faecousia faecipullorum]|nr:lipoprotein [Candidatus Faecousia faecipullorum]
MKKIIAAILALGLLLALAGCGKQEQTPSSGDLLKDIQ